MQTELSKAQEHVGDLETKLNEQLEKNAQFEHDLQSLQLEVGFLILLKCLSLKFIVCCSVFCPE